MAPETLGAPRDTYGSPCAIVHPPLLGRLFLLVPSYGGGSPALRHTVSTGVASDLHEPADFASDLCFGVTGVVCSGNCRMDSLHRIALLGLRHAVELGTVR